MTHLSTEGIEIEVGDMPPARNELARDAEFVAEMRSYLMEHSKDDFREDRTTTIKVNDLAAMLDVIDRLIAARGK